MIQMYRYGNGGFPGQVVGHESDMAQGDILVKARVELDDHRHPLRFRRLNGTADGLIIDGIDGGDTIVVLRSMFQKLVYLYQRHNYSPFTSVLKNSTYSGIWLQNSRL